MDEKDFLKQASGLFYALGNLCQQRLSTLGEQEQQRVALGGTGRLKGLKNQIKLIMDGGVARSTKEIAGLLYSNEMPMDFGSFLRRVTVTISSMHTKDGTMMPISTTTGPAWIMSQNNKGAEAPSL